MAPLRGLIEPRARLSCATRTLSKSLLPHVFCTNYSRHQRQQTQCARRPRLASLPHLPPTQDLTTTMTTTTRRSHVVVAVLAALALALPALSLSRPLLLPRHPHFALAPLASPALRYR
ncbi:hypothetical protein JVT61DRAFT_10099 [Boletus reticuloceps]|uniref:Uncharacterized protein n=1 Tax=Boletus reticuloceps TaxID=495285 RepID=A0A8I2YUQ6_9AGAM|nr:hypothetical protein JVT61DRAFT_10099 [Boletus reticuloceps]